MKYKLENLPARQKAWDASGGMNKESGHLHKISRSVNK